MKWRSLLKSKRQIGIIIVLTFTANVIMLYASLPFLLPGEQSHSHQKSLSKYDRQIFTNMEVNLTVNALEKEQKAIQNHIKSSKFSKNKGQMNFIPLSRTKFSKTKEGQMDFKSAGQTEGRNDVQPPNGVQFHANNQHVLEEINALANEKAGKVYHMYDDDVAVDTGIVAENLVQNNSPGIPKTFDENYIKYFWNHPEFQAEDSNFKVKTKEKQDISDKNTEVKNKKGYVKDKLNIRNTRQEVPKDSDKKNNFNHKVNVDQPKGKTYLTMYPARGKLGNQMFQLASLLGIADRGNFTPFLQMSQFELEEVFRFPKTFSRVIDTSTFKMFTENNYTQDISLKLCRNLNSRMNWSLDGWFQSFKYFNDVSEQVRHYLRFKKDVLRTAQEFIQKSVPVGHTSVAIHVRRGDFISAYEMKLGRVEVPPDYFERAMKYFHSKFKNITFVVVSDDIRWCKEFIKGDNVVYSTFYHNQKGVDLALISHCDHVIVSVGTFGWWGGWLSSGTVIYYNKFPTPGSALDKTFVPRNYYPSKWIPLK